MTPENIVDSAVNQGIQIIALTDHNSNQNVQRAIDYAKKYSDKILVLGGAEIRTAHGHLLVYFDPGKSGSLAHKT